MTLKLVQVKVRMRRRMDSSDMGLRKMPSRRWSKDAWRKSDGGYSIPDDKRGRESEGEVRSDERD
jgi:hypothetical protein